MEALWLISETIHHMSITLDYFLKLMKLRNLKLQKKKIPKRRMEIKANQLPVN